VQIAVAERVGVGGVEQPDALVQGEPDDVDRVLFGGATLRRQTKQAEPEGNVERAEDTVGRGQRGHGAAEEATIAGSAQPPIGLRGRADQSPGRVEAQQKLNR
jgi:hypothetical protein